MKAHVAEHRARRLGQHRAAAERDDRGLPVPQHLVRDLLLERTKAGLSPVLEELGDRRAGTRLDLAVEVDEAPAEACRSLAPEGRLAGAHEPGEREMAPERVRRTHLAAPSSSASRSHGTPPHRARSGS